MNFTSKRKKIFITICYYLAAICLYILLANGIDHALSNVDSGFINFLGFMMKVAYIILVTHGGAKVDDKYRVDPNAYKNK